MCNLCWNCRHKRRVRRYGLECDCHLCNPEEKWNNGGKFNWKVNRLRGNKLFERIYNKHRKRRQRDKSISLERTQLSALKEYVSVLQYLENELPTLNYEETLDNDYYIMVAGTGWKILWQPKLWDEICMNVLPRSLRKSIQNQFRVWLQFLSLNVYRFKVFFGSKVAEEYQLINFAEDDYVSKVAWNLEVCKLVEARFEYVCEMDGATVFKKRK